MLDLTYKDFKNTVTNETLIVSTREDLTRLRDWLEKNIASEAQYNVVQRLNSILRDSDYYFLEDRPTFGIFIQVYSPSKFLVHGGISSYRAIMTAASSIELATVNLTSEEDLIKKEDHIFDQQIWLQNRILTIGVDKAVEEYCSPDKQYIHDFHGKTTEEIIDFLDKKDMLQEQAVGDIVLNVFYGVAYISCNFVYYEGPVKFDLDVTVPYKFHSLTYDGKPSYSATLEGEAIEIPIPKTSRYIGYELQFKDKDNEILCSQSGPYINGAYEASVIHFSGTMTINK